MNRPAGSPEPEQLGSPTLADSILDRMVHVAHCFALEGESLRKTQV